MASAVIASTSPTSTTTETVARSNNDNEGDLGNENPGALSVSSSSSSSGGGGDNNNVNSNNERVPPATSFENRSRDPNPVINSSSDAESPAPGTTSIESEDKTNPHPSEMILRMRAQDEQTQLFLGLQQIEQQRYRYKNELNDNTEIIPGRTVATTTTTTSSGKGFGEGPLPRELRRIILEVAKTGKCSWLSWSQEGDTSSSSCNNKSYSVTNRKGGTGVEAVVPSVSASNLPPRGGFEPESPSLANADLSSSPLLGTPPGLSSWQHSTTNTNYASGCGRTVRKQQQQASSTGGGGSSATTATAIRSSTSSTGLPPRKRHRNGVVHKGGERLRFGNVDVAFGRTIGSSRKRPLALSGSSSNHAPGSISNANNNYSSAPSSVGSGRSTGSEPDYDSAQYECDSEGTSATTNSEISLRKTSRKKKGSGVANTQGKVNSGVDVWTDTATREDEDDEDETNSGSNAPHGSPYKTLQTAFRGALGLVLDHFYQNRDNGYKLSPAEKRRNERLAVTLNANSNYNNHNRDAAMTSDKVSSLLSSEHVFQQRRQRLMAMLLPSTTPHAGNGKLSEEPPFTIQRIAEVLVAPDRYYTQTHKLCNCLEKLLLVNSSTDSFGGSTGGDTSQRRREERELAALADEKGRQESKLRQRRLVANSNPIDHFRLDDTSIGALSASRSNSSSNNSDHSFGPEESTLLNPSGTNKINKSIGNQTVRSEYESMTSNNSIESSSLLSNKRKCGVATTDSSSSREALESLARDSLRSKFDPVGTDPLQNSTAAPTDGPNEKDAPSLSENREMTSSPPPVDGINMAASDVVDVVASNANASVPGHGDVNNGYVRQHLSEQQQQQHQSEDQDMVSRVASPILYASGNESHLETTATNMHMLQLHHAVAMAGISTYGMNLVKPPSSTLDTLFNTEHITFLRNQQNATGNTGPGSESTDGRSSASNSDIDSESDDISFDDSASDRSDGSDSGSTPTSGHQHEPFTAARAMALNRMQQQQRLQSRVLTSMGTTASSSSQHQGGEGFRPPADSEYQSGDSIDSTRAEDSGGSDSSSSDLVD